MRKNKNVYGKSFALFFKRVYNTGMSIKRVVSHKLYIVIITFILVSFFIFAGTKFFSRDAERQREKARSYTEQAVSFYEKNQMDDFLAIVGEALFYNELSENVEQEIYLYSLLSQYYLEIGADKSGYDTILAGRRLKNFYTIQDPFIWSQALHAYGRFLLSESDFESALKAETQMEEDSHFFEASDATYARYCYYRALGFKSYILMMQGKTEDSYALANTIYTEFCTLFMRLSTSSSIIVLSVFLELRSVMIKSPAHAINTHASVEIT